MKKIAFIIDTIESPTAGTEKQLLMLIKHLDRSRFEPTLFVLRSSPWLDHEFDLCPLVVIDFQSFARPASYRRFLGFVAALRKNKFDCIQTHFVESNIIGIIAGRLAGVPRIISSRRDQGYWHTPVKIMLYKVLNRWVHYFVANCHATAKWASEIEAIPMERMKIIYNGAELGLFQPVSAQTKNEIRDALGLKRNAFVVGIVANLRPVKSVATFVRAAAIAASRAADVQFVVAGDGEQRKELENMAAEAGIADKTFFLGKRTDIPRILAACDAAVLSSTSESFSNSIVEYFASGLPVISTDVGGCREMIEEGVNGYIVPVADAQAIAERVVELAATHERLETARGANREKARRMFSRESMVASFEMLYSGRNT
ncbi:GT4 family glycosyltransferase PelF [Geobacter sp. FeAm09]|uniref:GT4 family glycosyltransferase PelF n=1 Tax=Geobacter sp. FeAm09 TaxID=2597769 RepID=UPI00143D9586|nr:GT4 family glycosyltransferase PelF [Geobacter sp. FeAm09]